MPYTYQVVEIDHHGSARKLAESDYLSWSVSEAQRYSRLLHTVVKVRQADPVIHGRYEYPVATFTNGRRLFTGN